MTKETKTDYLGEYTAYTYDDGHVETSPVNRPVFKEDLQLQRTAHSAPAHQLLRPYTQAIFEVSRFAETVATDTNQIEAVLTTVPVGGIRVGGE